MCRAGSQTPDGAVRLVLTIRFVSLQAVFWSSQPKTLTSESPHLCMTLAISLKEF